MKVADCSMSQASSSNVIVIADYQRKERQRQFRCFKLINGATLEIFPVIDRYHILEELFRSPEMCVVDNVYKARREYIMQFIDRMRQDIPLEKIPALLHACTHTSNSTVQARVGAFSSIVALEQAFGCHLEGFKFCDQCFFTSYIAGVAYRKLLQEGAEEELDDDLTDCIVKSICSLEKKDEIFTFGTRMICSLFTAEP